MLPLPEYNSPVSNFSIQFPAGKPLIATLAVGKAQVICCIAPTTGAVGPVLIRIETTFEGVAAIPQVAFEDLTL